MDNYVLVCNTDYTDQENDGHNDACDGDDDGDGFLDEDDICPHNSQIGSTDFRGIQPIDLCDNCSPKPVWEFRDGGKEIWQGVNSIGAIAIGQDRLSAMDFSGTIFVDTHTDNDFVGFVFSFQDTKNFFVVYASKHNSNQGAWKIVRVASTTGPSRALDSAIWQTVSVKGQTEILWQDPKGRGWKAKTPYRYLLQHRPIAGTVRLQIHEGAAELFDTGNLKITALAGGRVGVFCSSQQEEIWSGMSYKCVQE